MATYQEFREELDHVNDLKDELKRHNMVFQVELKRDLAQFLDLHPEYFYSYSYQDWLAVIVQINKFRGEAQLAFRDRKDEIPGFIGFNGKTIYGLIYQAYKDHVEANGRDIKTEILGEVTL